MSASITSRKIHLKRRGRGWESYQVVVQEGGLVDLDELGILVLEVL
jgi:hypothetical protein